MPAAALPEPTCSASVQPPGARRAAPSPWRALGVLLASLMMLLGSASTARAVDCNQEGTFQGILQHINFEEHRVLVGERAFGYDGDTEIEDASGAQTQLENLFPGMAVEVRFCEQPGAIPVATRLRVREGSGSFTPTPTRTPGPTPTVTPTGTPGPCDARIAGVIVSANAEAGTLNIASVNTVAVLVQTNENTEFRGLEGETLAFGDFAPGLHAEAKGCIEQNPAGPAVLVAAEVRLLPTPSPTATFTPTPTRTPGPTPTATPTGTPLPCDSERYGMIDSINAEARTMMLAMPGAMLLVRTTEATEYENAAGEDVDFAFFQAGMFVKAQGCIEQTAAGVVMTAREIEQRAANTPTPTRTPGPTPTFTATPTVTPTPAPCNFHTVGPITEINAAERSFVLAGLNGAAGILVRTAEETEIHSANGEEVAFEYLATGMFVEVHGCFEQTPARPTVRAREVNEIGAPTGTITPTPTRTPGPTPTPTGTPNNCDFEMEGPIFSIDPASASMVVNGALVLTTPETEYENLAGDDVTFAFFRVGMIVKVHGCAGHDSAGQFRVVAREIEQEEASTPAPCREIRSGIVLEVLADQSALRIEGAIVRVGNATRLYNAAGEPVGFEYFAAGTDIVAEGCLLPVAGPLDVLEATAVRERNGNATPSPTPTPGPVNCNAEFKGLILALDAETGTLFVGQALVHTNEATQYEDEDGNAIGFGNLATGMFVEVHGCVMLDGAFLAREIEIEDGDGHNSQEVEFHGPISAIDAANRIFTVAGIPVLIEPATRLENADGNPIPFAAFEVGNFVRVRGVRHADNSVTARRVRQLAGNTNPNPQVEFRGFIDNIGENGGLIVSGQIVATNDQTQFLGRDGQPIAFADLQVGDHVEVKGARTAEGRVLASRIKREDPVNLEFRIAGRIDEIGDASYLVNGGLRIAVAENTRYFDIDGSESDASIFAVGDSAEFAGIRTPDGGHIAGAVRKLAAPQGPACEHRLEFTGRVDAVSTETMSLVVAGRSVSTTEDTRYFDADGAPASFGAIAPGMIATVKGNPATAGDPASGVVACEVRLRAANDDPPPVHRIYGRIASIDAETSSCVVLDRHIVTNADTRFVGRQGQPLSFADLRVGQRVEVLGNPLASGDFLARLFHILGENENPNDPFIRFGGPITALSLPDSITVGETIVNVADNPEVRGFAGTPYSLGDLRVGDIVRVRASDDPAKGLVARSIRLHGAVVSAVDETSRTLAVGGYAVATTNATVFRDKDATGTLSFEDIAVGDVVALQGRPAAPNTILAHLVVRLGHVEFSRTVPGFDTVETGIRRHRPVLRSRDNGLAFGYAALPQDSFDVAVNTLYEVKARVATDVADATAAPQVRLRANNASFLKGAYIAAESNNGARFSPTPLGTDYTFYYVPAAGGEGENWFASMDLLNVGGADAANAELELQNLSVRPVDLKKVSVLETLIDQSFDTTSEGWVSGDAREAYTPAVATSGVNGSLDLAAADDATFGFWTFDTAEKVQPGQTYRGRFYIRSSSLQNGTVPTFRVRLNLNSFSLASVAAIESVGTGSESPAGKGLVYDVYLHVPANADPADTLRASFDLMNFSGDDVLVPVSLDHFTLERIEIPKQ